MSKSHAKYTSKQLKTFRATQRKVDAKQRSQLPLDQQEKLRSIFLKGYKP